MVAVVECRIVDIFGGTLLLKDLNIHPETRSDFE